MYDRAVYNNVELLNNKEGEVCLDYGYLQLIQLILWPYLALLYIMPYLLTDWCSNIHMCVCVCVRLYVCLCQNMIQHDIVISCQVMHSVLDLHVTASCVCCSPQSVRATDNWYYR